MIGKQEVIRGSQLVGNSSQLAKHFANLAFSEQLSSKLPKVNWFRQDENHKFLWPGYGENSRVLKWIFGRCDGKVHAKDTPIGRVPELADLDTTGLDIKGAHVNELLRVDIEGWLAEAPKTLKGCHRPARMRRHSGAVYDGMYSREFST